MLQLFTSTKTFCRIFVEQLSILVMYFGNSLTRPHSTYNIDDKVKCLVEFEINLHYQATQLTKNGDRKVVCNCQG